MKTSPSPRWSGAVLIGITLLAGSPAPGQEPPRSLPTAPAAGPFATFAFPPDWETRFWAADNARVFLALEPKALAALVPVQAGIRFCRCPACEATEESDPLVWSLAQPRSLTCRACGVVVPSEKYPARTEKDKKEPPEEAVEVAPGVVHHYPYHDVEATRQHYPGERLYLAAKADHEAREFLAKAALYAAVRFRDQPADRKDAKLARLASLVLIRFAQVYPLYATHFDQPQAAKHFGPANLAPPYRQGYGTAKWDWSGALDVPLNLVVAYALVRDQPAFAEAGRALGVARPHALVENDLFRAAAAFVQNQPEAYSESTLQADRGLLAVGRLLNDPALLRDAQERLARLAERGFYHDGFWRHGTLAAHRRVVSQLDGWVDRFLAGTEMPMLRLAENAAAAVLATPRSPDVLQASWPANPVLESHRAPMLLGGTGLARLAVGDGPDALDLELRSLDAFGPDRIVRQALRVGVAGRPILDDLDEQPPLASGFDRASAAHNTVIVDGLNQRESLARAHEPAPGGNVLFFAADPDFQVVMLDDPRAYPQSVTRYRQTLVASAGPRRRYAVGIVEVHGGLQHDQLAHGPVGGTLTWRVEAPMGAAAESLLPAGLTFVPTSRAVDLRWFIQSYGELLPRAQGAITRPTVARLLDPGGNGLRLHLLGDMPLSVILAEGPDPARPGTRDGGRPALILRHRRGDGATLQTTFVTVYEPIAQGQGTLRRVGRVASSAETVVLYLETDDGPEHLVVNLNAGTLTTVALADGTKLTTDGLAVAASADRLVLAGGTVAEHAGRQARQTAVTGQVVAVGREPSPGSRGWFESDGPIAAEPEALGGRILIIRHGDGTTRAWTLDHVANTANGHARLFVREEPGFALDPSGPATRRAQYYQFPRGTVTGPHSFRIARIARAPGAPPARSTTAPNVGPK